MRTAWARNPRCRELTGWGFDPARWTSPYQDLVASCLEFTVVRNGGPGLRQWVDDPAASFGDWDAALVPDERSWAEERAEFLIY